MSAYDVGDRFSKIKLFKEQRGGKTDAKYVYFLTDPVQPGQFYKQPRH